MFRPFSAPNFLSFFGHSWKLRKQHRKLSESGSRKLLGLTPIVTHWVWSGVELSAKKRHWTIFSFAAMYIILKTDEINWKFRNWAFRGSFMGHSSLVTGQDMSDLIQENIEFRQTVGTWSLVNKERHNLAYDKARMAHERSSKSSVSLKCKFLNFQMIPSLFKISWYS